MIGDVLGESLFCPLQGEAYGFARIGSQSRIEVIRGVCLLHDPLKTKLFGATLQNRTLANTTVCRKQDRPRPSKPIAPGPLHLPASGRFSKSSKVKLR